MNFITVGFSEWAKKIRKKYFDEDEEERRSRVHHSLSYHRFFQGYSENKVLTDNAVGYKIQRVYTAHYLAMTASKKKWITYKFLYAGLFLVFAAGNLLALFSKSQANAASWTSIFGVLQLLMALMLLIPLGNYVAAPMFMKLGEYNISGKRLKKFSFPTLVLAGLYLLLSVIWYLVMQTVPNGKDLLCLLYQVVSTGAILTLYLLESHMEYRKIPNKSGFPNFQGEIW